jgi:prepilin-type N-terminal cleavage/methylation domain-containing protein
VNKRAGSRTSSPFAAGRARAAAVRRGVDAGFSLIELIVTMAVMALVMVIASALIIGFQQQTQNVAATVNGARQAQIASTALIQYLRAAIQIAGSPPLTGSSLTTLNTTPLAANASANSLGVIADVGTATAGETPTLTPIYATYTAGTGSLPTGTGTLAVQFGCNAAQGCASGVTHIVTTFFVLSPSQPIFTYYKYSPAPYSSPPDTTNVEGSLVAIPFVGSSIPAASLSSIVAVGIDVSFFAGPEDLPTRGYAADIATSLNTTVYLHNTVDYGSP